MKKFNIALITFFAASIVTSSFAVVFCTKENLSAVGQFEAAAGNSFGTFTLTNISAAPCKVLGNNQLMIQYPNAITNIKIKYPNKPSQKFFILNPKQSISASVHYPNGPQCNSPLDSPDVMFSYDIAPKLSMPFMNGTTANPFEITTCRSPKDITLIQISFFEVSSPHAEE